MFIHIGSCFSVKRIIFLLKTMTFLFCWFSFNTCLTSGKQINLINSMSNLNFIIRHISSKRIAIPFEAACWTKSSTTLQPLAGFKWMVIIYNQLIDLSKKILPENKRTKSNGTKLNVGSSYFYWSLVTYFWLTALYYY